MFKTFTKRDIPEFFLVILWFCYFLVLGTGLSRSYLELVVVLSPIVIVVFYGLSWLKDYDFKSLLFFGILQFWLISALAQLSTIKLIYGIDGIRSFNMKFLSIFFSLLFLLRKLENIEYIFWSITGLMIIFACFSYYNYFTPASWHLEAKHIYTQEHFPSAISPFGQTKNNFASYFSIYLPLCFGFTIYHYLQNGFYSKKFGVTFATILAAFPTLLLTLSRANFAATLISFCFLSLLLVIYQRKWTILILMIFIVGSSFLLLNTDVAQKHTKRWEIAEVKKSLKGRYENLWLEGFQKTKEHRIFGLDFSEESSKAIFGRSKGGHSLYVYFLMRIGILGLSSYLILLATIFYDALFTLGKTNSDIYFALQSGILSGILSGFVISVFTQTHPNLVFNLVPLLTLIFIVKNNLYSDNLNTG